MTDNVDHNHNPQPILVGIDGSNSSKAALKWAANQAKLSGLPLLAIATWQYPTAFGWAEMLPADIDFKGDTQRVLDESIKSTLGADHGLEITTRVVQGH